MDSFIEEITNATPFMFAQTREDPIIEIGCINDISIDHPLNICLIGSAGDTLCSIPTRNIARIDVIDANPHQLKLASLKYNLFYYLDKKQLKEFLNGSNIDHLSILINMCHDNKITADDFLYWCNHINLLKAGLNQAGRFEMLFKKLMVNEDFDQYFSHTALTKIFGENATKYSMKSSFPEHFKQILARYRMYYRSPKDNYFYHQFVYDCYDIDEIDLPIYLIDNDKLSHNLKPIIPTKVNFIHNNMLMHLKSKEDSSYEFIHLSNISDWLNSKDLEELLIEVYRVLKSKGKATLRRLNSDLELRQFLKKPHKKYRFELLDKFYDRSQFYLEVVCISKI